MRIKKLQKQAEYILSLCAQKGMKIAVAESCTGGLLSKIMTDISGASEVFLSGMVTYSNESKRKLLGVSANTLKEKGAVSEDVASDMINGLWKIFNAEIVISITGIAGPNSDDSQKKPPLTYIGIGTNFGGEKKLKVYRFSGKDMGRTKNRERVVSRCFEIIEKEII